jgi:ATP-dependent Lon protease
VQAIGGVNEKVDGYFEACSGAGLSGEQGVISPKSNAGDLMLHPRVVSACAEGQFSIYAVDDIATALEILTGVNAGAVDEQGHYPAGSLFAQVQQRATEFFRRSSGKQEV